VSENKECPKTWGNYGNLRDMEILWEAYLALEINNFVFIEVNVFVFVVIV